MNKLKKQRPSESANPSNTGVMSRTMQLAVSGVKVSTTRGGELVSSSANLQRRSTWSAPLVAASGTKIEQYWAARALVAETLLSARDRHQDELAEMRRIEERKRERDIAVILHANDQRQRRLEQLMAICLVVLLGLMAWLVSKITSDQDAGKGRSSRPSHFTIPILSPFTSVVEHETGIFGTKAITIFVLVIGIALYAALKHRLSQWRAR